MGTSLKELVEKQISVALACDWDALRKLYADDVRYRDPDGELKGADEAVRHLQEQMVAFPDAGTHSIQRVYEVGNDAAIAEWTATLRNTGPLHLPDGGELPATGREITIDMVTIYDIADGLIVSERNYWDNASLFGQLGLLPE